MINQQQTALAENSQKQKNLTKLSIYFFTKEPVEYITPQDSKLNFQASVSKRGIQKITVKSENSENNQKIIRFLNKEKLANGSTSNVLFSQFTIKYENFDETQLFQLPVDQNFGHMNEKYFIYGDQVLKVRKNNLSRPVIISTDIGGTLVGDEEGLKKFNLLYLQYFYFDKKNILIYNSGRSIQSYLKAEKEHNLIKPDYFISRCGVIIYKNQKGSYIPDENWTSKIQIDWNYNLVIEKIQQIKWLNHKKNDHDQNLCIKFVCPNEIFDENSNEFYQVEQELHKLCNFECIVRTKTSRKCIDFIPISTNKGQALEYLCKNQIREDMQYTIAFGDTMNDCAMLEKAGKGVLVKNSMPDVVNWMTEIQNSNCNGVEINNGSVGNGIQQRQQQQINSVINCSHNQVNNNNNQSNISGITSNSNNIGIQSKNININNNGAGQERSQQIQHKFKSNLYHSSQVNAQALVEALEQVMVEK